MLEEHDKIFTIALAIVAPFPTILVRPVQTRSRILVFWAGFWFEEEEQQTNKLDEER